MSDVRDYENPTYHRIPVPLTDEGMAHLKAVQEFYRKKNIGTSAAENFLLLMEREYEEIMTAKNLSEGTELPFKY